MGEELKKLIVKTQAATDIRNFARSRGFKSMREDGIRKVLSGITTPEEVLRAVKAEEG